MELIEPQNAIRNANNSKIMAQIAMEIFPRRLNIPYRLKRNAYSRGKLLFCI